MRATYFYIFAVFIISSVIILSQYYYTFFLVLAMLLVDNNITMYVIIFVVSNVSQYDNIYAFGVSSFSKPKGVQHHAYMCIR